MTLEQMFATGDIVEFRAWCKTASPRELTSAWVKASSQGLQNFADHAHSKLIGRGFITEMRL